MCHLYNCFSCSFSSVQNEYLAINMTALTSNNYIGAMSRVTPLESHAKIVPIYFIRTKPKKISGMNRIDYIFFANVTFFNFILLKDSLIQVSDTGTIFMNIL